MAKTVKTVSIERYGFFVATTVGYGKMRTQLPSDRAGGRASQTRRLGPNEA